MFFDDELAAQRDHEEHAEPTAEEREGKDAPEGELRAEAEKDQRGDGEHHAGGQRFSRRAGGLHDVVFKNRGAAERAQNADGEHGDGDGGGDGQAGAQTDVDGDGAEEQTKERAENDGAHGEFF